MNPIEKTAHTAVYGGSGTAIYFGLSANEWAAFGGLIAAVALLAIDWRQTLTIFRRGRREKNRVIRWAHARWGLHGIDGYFLVCVAGTGYIHQVGIAADQAAINHYQLPEAA